MTEPSKDTARPRFFMMAVQNMSLSEMEGRPIFEDKEMVEIRIPGDKHYSWVGPTNEKMRINGQEVDSRERFAESYAAFKRGEQQATIGTPLEHWPNAAMTAARVAELKALNVFSVEDLAGVSDSHLGKMGVGPNRELRDQARAYIDKAKGGAETAKMAAEIARLTEMVDRLAGAQQVIEPPPEPVTIDQTPSPFWKTKTLEDCTDDELKTYIKRETGQGVRGNPKRDTLLAKAAEVAQKVAA